MKYEGVSFNVSWVKSFEKPEQFAGHKSVKHLWPRLSDAQRTDRLKEVYLLCVQYPT